VPGSAVAAASPGQQEVEEYQGNSKEEKNELRLEIPDRRKNNGQNLSGRENVITSSYLLLYRRSKKWGSPEKFYSSIDYTV
jgi:hypothetical protein